MTLTLFDPDENEIKVKETWATKYEDSGKISESGFRVPTDAVPGTWKIKASSGSNFDFAEFEVVLDTELVGMVIMYQGIDTLPTIGKLANFRILGTQQSTFIEIYSSANELVGSLNPPTGGSGEVYASWPIPRDLPPGTYTLKVWDSSSNATMTFEYEG